MEEVRANMGCPSASSPTSCATYYHSLSNNASPHVTPPTVDVFHDVVTCFGRDPPGQASRQINGIQKAVAQVPQRWWSPAAPQEARHDPHEFVAPIRCRTVDVFMGHEGR